MSESCIWLLSVGYHLPSVVMKVTERIEIDRANKLTVCNVIELNSVHAVKKI